MASRHEPGYMGLTRLARLATAHQRAVEAIDDSLEARDRAILDAADAGWTARQIARAVGRTHVQVMRIIAEQAVIRQHEQPPEETTP